MLQVQPMNTSQTILDHPTKGMVLKNYFIDKFDTNGCICEVKYYSFSPYTSINDKSVDQATKMVLNSFRHVLNEKHNAFITSKCYVFDKRRNIINIMGMLDGCIYYLMHQSTVTFVSFKRYKNTHPIHSHEYTIRGEFISFEFFYNSLNFSIDIDKEKQNVIDMIYEFGNLEEVSDFFKMKSI